MKSKTTATQLSSDELDKLEEKVVFAKKWDLNTVEDVTPRIAAALIAQARAAIQPQPAALAQAAPADLTWDEVVRFVASVVAIPAPADNAELYTLRRLIECAEKLDARPRPMCRDCADENGTCPNGGLECDMRKLFADAKRLYDRLAAAPALQAQPAGAPTDMADAYVGAREDMAIWKKRAREAEASCRRLTAALLAQNGPTRMGTPAKPTDEMCIAARDKFGIGANHAEHIYLEMVKHAPAQPAGAPTEDRPTWADVQARERDIRALQSRIIELEAAAQPAGAGAPSNEQFRRSAFCVLASPDSGIIARAISKEWADRIVYALACQGAAPAQTEPVASEARVNAIVTALYRRFKDWSKRGFRADDVTWCEVKADVMALIATAPAHAGAAQAALPRALGVSRDAESPDGKGVLVTFHRALTDDELRVFHDSLAAPTQPAAPKGADHA